MFLADFPVDVDAVSLPIRAQFHFGLRVSTRIFGRPGRRWDAGFPAIVAIEDDHGEPVFPIGVRVKWNSLLSGVAVLAGSSLSLVSGNVQLQRRHLGLAA